MGNHALLYGKRHAVALLSMGSFTPLRRKPSKDQSFPESSLYMGGRRKPLSKHGKGGRSYEKNYGAIYKNPRVVVTGKG